MESQKLEIILRYPIFKFIVIALLMATGISPLFAQFDISDTGSVVICT
jgi:hypothetical protein